MIPYLRGNLVHLPASTANIPILMAMLDILGLPGEQICPENNALTSLLTGTLLKYLQLLDPQPISSTSNACRAREHLESCITLDSRIGADGGWIAAHARFELAELEGLVYGNWDGCEEGLRRILSGERGSGTMGGSRPGEGVEIPKSPSTSIIVTDASSPPPSLSNYHVLGGRGFSGNLSVSGHLPSFVRRSDEEVGGVSGAVTSPSGSGVWKVGSPSSVHSHASLGGVGSGGRRYPFKNTLRQRCHVALQEVGKRRRGGNTR